MTSTPTHIRANYYPSHQDVFPNVLEEDGVSLCFSGGGSRACTATMGILRGLHQLGLLTQKNIPVISSVSGSTWALLLYTYRLPNIDIDTILGKPVAPAKLLWESPNTSPENLNYVATHCIGSVPTRLGIKDILCTMLELHKQYDYAASDLWLRTIGKRVLEPFALSEVDAKGTPIKWMSYTDDWTYENALALNPNQWLMSDFDRVPTDPLRPYLITNTSIFANASTLLPYEISPCYQGILATQSVDDIPFGGGYVDTYAFGSTKPQRKPANQVDVLAKPSPFCLADAAGLSSAFYAAIIEGEILSAKNDLSNIEKKWGFLKNELNPLTELVSDFGQLNPKFSYWSVKSLDSSAAQAKSFEFADGGGLEASGIIPLLQRSSKKIISCINGEALKETETGLIVDQAIPRLFGFCPVNAHGEIYYKKYAEMSSEELKKLPFSDQLMFEDQVFPSDLFFTFLDQIKKASTGNSQKLGQEPAIFIQDLSTVKNVKFGIEAGQSLRVLWVYTNWVQSWFDQLPKHVQQEMHQHPLDFKAFPNYNVITQIHLTPRQVNLLAHLSCWCITQKENVFKTFFQEELTVSYK